MMLDEKRMKIDVGGTGIVLSCAENANRLVQSGEGSKRTTFLKGDRTCCTRSNRTASSKTE